MAYPSPKALNRKDLPMNAPGSSPHAEPQQRNDGSSREHRPAPLAENRIPAPLDPRAQERARTRTQFIGGALAFLAIFSIGILVRVGTRYPGAVTRLAATRADEPGPNETSSSTVAAAKPAIEARSNPVARTARVDPTPTDRARSSDEAATDEPPVQQVEVPAAAAGARAVAKTDAALGRELFAHEWLPNDPRAHGGDGLGPVFNERSCAACHSLGGPGGAGPNSRNVEILATSTATVVLHRGGTDPAYDSWRARVKERIPDAAGLTSGSGTTTLSRRSAPSLFGAGLIDAVPASVLIATAAQQPARVRGRVIGTKDGSIGRFGWKAQVSSLQEFVLTACANELGLEVPGHHQVRSPLGSAAKAAALDLTEAECDSLVAYVRELPAPAVYRFSQPVLAEQASAGRVLFQRIGCANCHVPKLGDINGIYSDLLVHDMGRNLDSAANCYTMSDGTGATSAEWRTPPLWGFRDSAPYLHDGRAATLAQVVSFHGGQAAESAEEFAELSLEEQTSMTTFLKSLVVQPPRSDHDMGPEVAYDLDRQLRSRVAKQEADQARREETVAKHAATLLHAAENLERMGKHAGALEFYRQIVHDSPDSAEAKAATARIKALGPR